MLEHVSHLHWNTWQAVDRRRTNRQRKSGRRSPAILQHGASDGDERLFSIGGREKLPPCPIPFLDLSQCLSRLEPRYTRPSGTNLRRQVIFRWPKSSGHDDHRCPFRTQSEGILENIERISNGQHCANRYPCIPQCSCKPRTVCVNCLASENLFPGGKQRNLHFLTPPSPPGIKVSDGMHIGTGCGNQNDRNRPSDNRRLHSHPSQHTPAKRRSP